MSINTLTQPRTRAAARVMPRATSIPTQSAQSRTDGGFFSAVAEWADSLGRWVDSFRHASAASAQLDELSMAALMLGVEPRSGQRTSSRCCSDFE